MRSPENRHSILLGGVKEVFSEEVAVKWWLEMSRFVRRKSRGGNKAECVQGTAPAERLVCLRNSKWFHAAGLQRTRQEMTDEIRHLGSIQILKFFECQVKEFIDSSVVILRDLSQGFMVIFSYQNYHFGSHYRRWS